VKAIEQPPISPSKALLRFAERIGPAGIGTLLDTPCGYGRNALALAARGWNVIAVDNDRGRLNKLVDIKAASTAETASALAGQIHVICADLSPGRWPFAPSSVEAIICVHFAMLDLLPYFTSSLRTRGHIYIETFGGHGQNYLELPKAGQLRERLLGSFELKYYKERKVGPEKFNKVSATLFAQKNFG